MQKQKQKQEQRQKANVKHQKIDVYRYIQKEHGAENSGASWCQAVLFEQTRPVNGAYEFIVTPTREHVTGTDRAIHRPQF